MKVEDKLEIKVENSDSRITFETTGGGSWEVWDRFIALDKEKMYHIGNVCGTCQFFFKKQSKSIEVNFNQKHLIEELNNGNLEFSELTVNELSKIIPNGNYLVVKSKIKPEIVTNNSDNNYFNKEQLQTWRDDYYKAQDESEFNSYYREPLRDFGKMEHYHKEAFFNFFVPLYSAKELNKSRVEFYKSKLLKGDEPKIVSVGVLDVKTSVEYPLMNGEEVNPEFGTHWCLANYIIDGHHKIKAASELNQEIDLITFISRDESWKLVDDMIRNLIGEKKKKWQFWKK